jgi:hypothetical protein
MYSSFRTSLLNAAWNGMEWHAGIGYTAFNDFMC